MDPNLNSWFTNFSNPLHSFVPTQLYEANPTGTPTDDDNFNEEGYEEGEISEAAGDNTDDSREASHSHESGEIEEDSSDKYDPAQPLLLELRGTTTNQPETNNPAITEEQKATNANRAARIREKLLAMRASTPKMSPGGNMKDVTSQNNTAVETNVPTDIDSLVEQGRADAAAAAAKNTSTTVNSGVPQTRSEPIGIESIVAPITANGPPQNVNPGQWKKSTLDPVQQLREYDKLQRFAARDSKTADASARAGPSTGPRLSNVTQAPGKSGDSKDHTGYSTTDSRRVDEIPFRAAHIPLTTEQNTQPEEEETVQHSNSQADTPIPDNQATTTEQQLTLRSEPEPPRTQDTTADTPSTINTPDIDIADWLELTGFHDASYRSRRLVRHRRTKALRLELENLEREEQLEGNYATTRAQSSSQPPAEVIPRLALLMAPPQLPPTQTEHVATTSAHSLPPRPPTSKETPNGPSPALNLLSTSSPTPAPSLPNPKRHRSPSPISSSSHPSDNKHPRTSSHPHNHPRNHNPPYIHNNSSTSRVNSRVRSPATDAGGSIERRSSWNNDSRERDEYRGGYDGHGERGERGGGGGGGGAEWQERFPVVGGGGGGGGEGQRHESWRGSSGSEFEGGGGRGSGVNGVGRGGRRGGGGGGMGMGRGGGGRYR